MTNANLKLHGWIVLIFAALVWLGGTGLTPTPQGQLDAPPAALKAPAPFLVSANSGNHVERYEIPSPDSRDRWIQGIAFHPGDERVLTSVLFSIDKTGQWLGVWTPDEKILTFPETVAAYFPAGAKLIMEVHYQSIGEDVRDNSSVDLIFAAHKPLRPLTGMGIETRVDVPADETHYHLTRELTVISDSYLMAIHPEMPSTGRSVEVSALDPSGASQVLLSTDDYRQNAQNVTIFGPPVLISRGSRITVSASFENPEGENVDDPFKVTMMMYPAAEYRAIADPAPARSSAKKSAAKKTTTRKRAPAKKKP